MQSLVSAAAEASQEVRRGRVEGGGGERGDCLLEEACTRRRYNQRATDIIMELSKRTIRGLENVQNSSLINDETFSQLLDIVSTDIVHKNDATKSE